jgi:hypothetical protein
MEKVPGIELERVWPKMEMKDKFTVIKAIAGFQKSWTSVSFTKFGSLYFADDLEEMTRDEATYVNANGNEIVDKNFAVGPSTGRESVDDGRATIEFDRGPCKTCVATQAFSLS